MACEEAGSLPQAAPVPMVNGAPIPAPWLWAMIPACWVAALLPWLPLNQAAALLLLGGRTIKAQPGCLQLDVVKFCGTET